MNLHEIAAYRTADEQTRREIERCIDSLPDPQTREMFRLHFIEGMSYSRVAERLGGGMSRECVYSRIHRCAKRHCCN